MVDAPELTTMTRRRTVQPLVAAWVFVVVALAAVFIWLSLAPGAPSDDGVTAARQGSGKATASVATKNNVMIPSTTAGAGSKTAEQNLPPFAGDDRLPDHAPAGRLSLAKAPIEGLVIAGANGPLPVLGPDSMVAWKAYARPVAVSAAGSSTDKPEIAIIITGIGLNSRMSARAIKELPGQIDLAFSPYGRKLQYWMDKSRQYGHEGFLMMPAEPLKYPENDPGPYTLLTGVPLRDNLKKLDWILSRLSGYVGVINEMGSKFTTSEADILPVLQSLKARGLMLLDARSTRFSIAAKLARRISMPRAVNNLYLDNVVSAKMINRNLARLENIAHSYGTAIGETRASPLAIEEIAKWARQLEARGFRLVPVTAIANRQPVR